jgi:hypothetical protein
VVSNQQPVVSCQVSVEEEAKVSEASRFASGTAYRLPPTAYRLPPTAYRLPPNVER